MVTGGARRTASIAAPRRPGQPHELPPRIPVQRARVQPPTRSGALARRHDLDGSEFCPFAATTGSRADIHRGSGSPFDRCADLER